MRTSTRDRLVLPILLPVGILVAIAVILFAFSRILLSLHADAATATALIVAFAIMVVAGIAASRTHVAASTLASMVGVIAGVAMLAGGIALLAFGAGEEEAPDGEGPGVVIALFAKDIAFDQTSLTVPAGEPFAIDFDNRDARIQHNVQIFDNPDFTGPPLFPGDPLITGPDSVTYDVDPLEPGTYYFNCVVHPAQMQGTIEVREGPPGGGGGPTVDVTAQGIQFDTDRIDLPAGAPATIHFENNDPVQHNVAIFTDDTLANVLFRGDLVTGPDVIDYPIPPLEPGTYYFRCDIHPSMSGTVGVSGERGGGPPEPAATTTPSAP